MKRLTHRQIWKRCRGCDACVAGCGSALPSLKSHLCLRSEIGHTAVFGTKFGRLYRSIYSVQECPIGRAVSGGGVDNWSGAMTTTVNASVAASAKKTSALLSKRSLRAPARCATATTRSAATAKCARIVYLTRTRVEVRVEAIDAELGV